VKLMANVKLCDRCGSQFSGWRAATRKYILNMDVLRNSTTPTVRHKSLDICPDCNKEMVKWYENEEAEINV